MSNRCSNLPAIDTVISMARDDPDSIETLRIRLSQEIIDLAKTDSRKRRLKGIQFVVDINATVLVH